MKVDAFRLLPWMTIFFMAMAFLESAVVVYLRALYYPQGFEFPIVPMDEGLVTTEIWREAATMVMLLAPAALVTRKALERFAWFCFGFGVWDIFYYVWLKVLLDWPESFGTMDLLFLIPIPWVGPVWAPVLVSAGLILLALVLLKGTSRPGFRLNGPDLLLLSAGATFIIFSFMLDPIQQGIFSMDPGSGQPLGIYRPREFPVWIFLVGISIAFAGLVRVCRDARCAGS
jgi:hypothetical protein